MKRAFADAARRGADAPDPAGLVEGYAWLHLVTPGKLREHYPNDSRIGILRVMDDVRAGMDWASQFLTPEQVEEAAAESRALAAKIERLDCAGG